MISHGMSGFLKERMMESSDAYVFTEPVGFMLTRIATGCTSAINVV